MVMMLSLFDDTKPETSKQHYERLYLYIKFQTKSGHLTDPDRSLQTHTGQDSISLVPNE